MELDLVDWVVSVSVDIVSPLVLQAVRVAAVRIMSANGCRGLRDI
ncbi:hypothetical protein FHU42_000143 [Corynebacterium glutamicum]|nr:hypothetical protein [Corynebacterium glutamicum]